MEMGDSIEEQRGQEAICHMMDGRREFVQLTEIKKSSLMFLALHRCTQGTWGITPSEHYRVTTAPS